MVTRLQRSDDDPDESSRGLLLICSSGIKMQTRRSSITIMKRLGRRIKMLVLTGDAQSVRLRVGHWSIIRLPAQVLVDHYYLHQRTGFSYSGK